MLAAIIILSLLSLLVATEADPSGAHQEISGEEPLRPPRKHANKPRENGGRPGRLAA